MTKETGLKFNKSDWIYDLYKEPLKPVEKGHGYYGVIIRSKDGERVQSHIDGKFYQSINNAHVKKAGFSRVYDYKKYYGIGIGTPLVGKSLQKTLQVKSLKYYLANPAELRARGKLGRKVMIEKKINEARTGSHFAVEHRNRNGTCHDQLMDKIRQVAKEVGHSPSTDDFRKKYGTRYMGTIYFHYGSWVNAVKLAGFTPKHLVNKEIWEVTRLERKAEKKRLRKQKWDEYFVKQKEELLQRLKIFYKVNGFSPTTKYFGAGMLPSKYSYWKYFGGLNKARREAGIPEVLSRYELVKRQLQSQV